MKKYNVAYMVVYSDVVEADNPEKAANMVANDCPYDVDGLACVTDLETGEQFEV